MFLTLSLDLTLHVLSYLNFAELARLHLTCRSTHRFLNSNEDAIYHQFAVILRLVSPGSNLEELRTRDPVWLKDIKTWKDLCIRSIVLERNWSGRGTVTQGGYLCYGSDDVQRFKVDEQEQTILAITSAGPVSTLSVRAIEDGKLLWSLEAVEQVELSKDWLLLWGRRGPGIEIWRKARSIVSSPPYVQGSPLSGRVPLAAKPSQLLHASTAITPEDNTSQRGVFVPHGFLPNSSSLPFLAYRLHGKIAAVIDMAQTHTVQLYDIEIGIPLRTLNMNAIIRQSVEGYMLRAQPEEFVFLDIDLTATHLCVTFDWALVIVPLYETSPGVEPPAIVYMDSVAPLDVRWLAPRLVPYETRSDSDGAIGCPVIDKENNIFTIPTRVSPMEIFTVSLTRPEGRDPHPPGPWRPGAEWSPCFVSARFSPDGQHIVAGTSFGLLYLLQNFHRLQNPAAVNEVVQKLNFLDPISRISWAPSHDKRVLITLDSQIVFILMLTEVPASDSAGASVTLHRARAGKLHPLTAASQFGVSQNLQMTKTRLWFSSRPDAMYSRLQARLRAAGGEPGEHARDTPFKGFQLKTTACFMDFTGR